MTSSDLKVDSSGHISKPSSSLAYINTVLDTAVSLGVERHVLLASVDLVSSDMEDPNQRVPMDTLLRILSNGAKLSNNPDFGLHVGLHIKAGSFGLLGYLTMCCSSMRERIELLLQFRRIAFDAGQTLLYPDGSNTILIWHPLKQAFDQERYLVDAIFSGWICFARQSGKDDLIMTRTDFTYPEPADTTMHRQLLGGEVYFDQPQNRVHVPTQQLDEPQPQANNAIFEALNKEAYAFIQELNSQDSMRDKVRHSLYRLLPKGDGNIEMVSEALNMNRRNLQRKLSGESTNFKQLLNELREELAEQYLRDQNLSMMDIAMLLGFSDNSAFTTAFKGWKTISPSEHRKITEQAK